MNSYGYWNWFVISVLILMNNLTILLFIRQAIYSVVDFECVSIIKWINLLLNVSYSHIIWNVEFEFFQYLNFIENIDFYFSNLLYIIILIKK